MPQLITPIVGLHESWLSAREEFGIGVHQDGAGLSIADEVTTPEGFAAWVARLRAAADPEPNFWMVRSTLTIGGSLTARSTSER